MFGENTSAWHLGANGLEAWAKPGFVWAGCQLCIQGCLRRYLVYQQPSVGVAGLSPLIAVDLPPNPSRCQAVVG